MKHFCRSSIIAMAILLFLFCAGPSIGQEKKIVLRIADSFPPGHFMIRYCVKPWMEKVTKATNGLVECQHYPSEQLGKAKDILALTLSGVADIGYVGPSYVTEKMPLSAVVELPGGGSLILCGD
jgi:TRAP-type C4-dicarboxylate transport system substrate-binding protein